MTLNARRFTYEERPSSDHQVTQGETRCQAQRHLFDFTSRGVEQFFDVEEFEDLLRTEPGSDCVGTGEKRRRAESAKEIPQRKGEDGDFSPNSHGRESTGVSIVDDLHVGVRDEDGPVVDGKVVDP